MNIDRIDRKILHALDYDARLPLTALARAAGLSKQGCHHRLDRLRRSGVIKSSTVLIDIHKLGFTTYRTYFRLHDLAMQEKVIAKLKEHPNIIWLVSIVGPFDLEAVFAARNPVHCNNLLKELREELGAYVSRSRTSPAIVNYHFPRDYLVEKDRDGTTWRHYGFEPETLRLQELDTRILRALAKESRTSTLALGRKLGVSHHTVRDRMRKLEESGIIQAYRIFIDINRIGRTYFKARVQTAEIGSSQERELYQFISRHPIVVYLVEALDPWNLEIEAEALSQAEFVELLDSVRKRFPGALRDYELMRIREEHVLNYVPQGIL